MPSDFRAKVKPFPAEMDRKGPVTEAGGLLLLLLPHVLIWLQVVRVRGGLGVGGLGPGVAVGKGSREERGQGWSVGFK